MHHLSLKEILLPDETFQIFRVTHNRNNPPLLHDHLDFAEVFFVEKGEGLHLVNDEKLPLYPGCLCFIRPEDRHTIECKDGHTPITIVNTAFLKETLAYFQQRYTFESGKFFWSDQKLPFQATVDSPTLMRLTVLAEKTIQKPRLNRVLDQYLLKILDLNDPVSLAEYPDNTPSWLAYALDNFNSPSDLAKGISRFIELTCRSQEHTNRELRKYLNLTLSETVNLARINYAARQLIMTDDKISTIAMDCNFQSLGYFYKLFKLHFRMSPDKYRRQNKALL